MLTTLKNYNKSIFIFYLFPCFLLQGQSFLDISGTITDDNNNPISNALISISDDEYTFSDDKGKYTLRVKINDKNSIYIKISHNDFYNKEEKISINQSPLQLNFTLNKTHIKEKEIKEIVFIGKKKSSDLTASQINTKNINKLPSLSGGIEEILNTAFVSTANELSSLYRVRGGNYDENLTYINGIEVYKPLTIRNAQQEGMSIINPNMVSMINFSAGGFEAQYGDKMSSVLDITYKKPTSFEADLEASLLGGSATIGWADSKQKFSGIIGTRYRDTEFILNTLSGDSDFNPKYFDIQSFLQYKANDKWNFSFLGNYSLNDYFMIPKSKQVDFGSFNQPIRLNVFYNGKEKDAYATLNGTVSVEYKPTKKLVFKWDGYAIHSKEEENFDIVSSYNIRNVINENGDSVPTFDSGGQIDHGRNNLDMLILGSQIKGKYNFSINNAFEAGVKYQKEDIRNLINEWQLIDSTGYSIPKSIPIPGNLNDSNLNLNYLISSNNKLNSNRISGFIQYTSKFMWNSTRILINGGIRASYWDFNEETIISPRAQIAVKPDWSTDILFRFATGFYYQAPFYKEALRLDGSLNKNIKSQRSIHFILGTDYEFNILNDRPFKLTTEIYYKKLDNLVPYFVDNIRVIYTGENNSTGYIYGIDTRLNGEFIPGRESWISLSYARAKENINNQGYISLPTDPRLKLGLFFQDYMPKYPQLKANVNLVYASGLPNGAPLFSNPYQYQSRLSDYKRVDTGLTYIIKNQTINSIKNISFLNKCKELSVGLEIFNIFDIRNNVNNNWIKDVNSMFSYAVPNRLTGRFFNLKIKAYL